MNARDQRAAKIDLTIAKERCRRSVASRCYAAGRVDMWFVHCMTKDLAARLMPILDGLPIGVLSVDSGGNDTHVKITASEDVANVIHDAGFNVAEA